MVVQVYIPSTQEVEARRPEVQSLPWLHSDLQLGMHETLSKKQKQKTNKTKQTTAFHFINWRFKMDLGKQPLAWCMWLEQQEARALGLGLLFAFILFQGLLCSNT